MTTDAKKPSEILKESEAKFIAACESIARDGLKEMLGVALDDNSWEQVKAAGAEKIVVETAFKANLIVFLDAEHERRQKWEASVEQRLAELGRKTSSAETVHLDCQDVTEPGEGWTLAVKWRDGDPLTPIDRIRECDECGSLVSVGTRNVGPKEKFSWCPACDPGCPWRYGPVVEESAKARSMREAPANPRSEKP